jgi:hypothetical protein
LADDGGRFFANRFDTACASKVTRIPRAESEAMHLVRLAPYVSSLPLEANSLNSSPHESLVHHMDVFVCGERAAAPPDDKCLTTEFVSAEGPCYAIVWARRER